MLTTPWEARADASAVPSSSGTPPSRLILCIRGDFPTEPMSVLVESARDDSQQETAVVESVGCARSLAGQVAFTVSIGLLLVAYAGLCGSYTGGTVDLLYWPGVILFPGPAWAALSPKVSRRDRITAVVLGGVATTISRVLLYPTHFAYLDELLHMKQPAAHPGKRSSVRGHEQHASCLDVLPRPGGGDRRHPSHHRAFHARCGLGVADRRSTGVMLSLVRSLEWITKSLARRASAQRSTSAVSSSRSSTRSSRTSPWHCRCASSRCVPVRHARPHHQVVVVDPGTGLFAAAMSHHLTTLGAVLVFVGWWAISRIRKTPNKMRVDGAHCLWHRRRLDRLRHDQVLLYVKEIFQSSPTASRTSSVAIRRATNCFADNGGERRRSGRAPFSVSRRTAHGFGLAVALWKAFKDRKSKSSAAIALLFVSVLYPLIPASHLTVTSAEVGDRSSSFVYVGVAFALAGWIALLPAKRVVRTAAFGAMALLYTAVSSSVAVRRG